MKRFVEEAAMREGTPLSAEEINNLDASMNFVAQDSQNVDLDRRERERERERE